MDVTKNNKKNKNDSEMILTLQKDCCLEKDLRSKPPTEQFFEATSQNSKKTPAIIEQYEHRQSQSDNY